MFCLLLRPSIPEADRRARLGAAGPSWTPPGPASRGQRPGGAPEGVTAWGAGDGTPLSAWRGAWREALTCPPGLPRVGKRGRTRFIRPGRRDTQAFPAVPQHVQPDTDKAGSHRRPLRGAGAHLTPLWPGPEVTGRSRSAEGLAASGRQVGAAGLGGRPEQPGHRRSTRAARLAAGAGKRHAGERHLQQTARADARGAGPAWSLQYDQKALEKVPEQARRAAGSGPRSGGSWARPAACNSHEAHVAKLGCTKESENQLNKLCLICNHISS